MGLEALKQAIQLIFNLVLINISLENNQTIKLIDSPKMANYFSKFTIYLVY